MGLKPENKGQLQELLKFHVLPYQCRTVEPGTEGDCRTGCNGGIYQTCPGHETLDSHRALTTYIPGKNPGKPQPLGYVISGRFSYDTNCNYGNPFDPQGQQKEHLCAQVT